MSYSFCRCVDTQPSRWRWSDLPWLLVAHLPRRCRTCNRRFHLWLGALLTRRPTRRS